MKVFIREKDSKVMAFTEKRLQIYRRLLRINNDNPEGLQHVLRVLKGFESLALEHRHIVQELFDIKFVRMLQSGDFTINTDEKDFINYITQIEHGWFGIFGGGFKPIDISLRTDLQMATKSNSNDVVSERQNISSEEMQDKNQCIIL